MDIVLYLIMPPEDFRCRPLRFLLREVIGLIVLIPLKEFFSEKTDRSFARLLLRSTRNEPAHCLAGQYLLSYSTV